MGKRALVVLSGGQDSATCVAWAATRYDSIECLTFDYNQRHLKEIDAAKRIARLFNAPHTLKRVPILVGNPVSGLTNASVDVHEKDGVSGLPKSFVPGRNLVFLTSAASYALSRGITDVVTGVCQTDYSGYPDCRQNTITALELAINLGNEGCTAERLRILTPLMFLTKKETVELALTLHLGLEAVGLSWTCYLGGRVPCGSCPACVLRAKGFAEVGIPDPANIVSRLLRERDTEGESECVTTSQEAKPVSLP